MRQAGQPSEGKQVLYTFKKIELMPVCKNLRRQWCCNVCYYWMTQPDRQALKRQFKALSASRIEYCICNIRVCVCAVDNVT